MDAWICINTCKKTEKYYTEKFQTQSDWVLLLNVSYSTDVWYKAWLCLSNLQ